MWYKLLPVILYFVTSHLLYKIAMEIGFEEKKAKFCKFAFLVCPIGIYSQFIFSQYDIFMIFFLVLGVYYYFKDGLFRFALFFGIAATFKYQALAYFAVLLVLREKDSAIWQSMWRRLWRRWRLPFCLISTRPISTAACWDFMP